MEPLGDLRFSHLVVGVTDMDRALAFYTEKVGLSVVTDMPYDEGGGRWIELAIAGADKKWAKAVLHEVRRQGGNVQATI